MANTDPQLKIRLPVDVKDFIQREAQSYGSSMNSEIIRAIRAEMKRREDDRDGQQIDAIRRTYSLT